ncbi:MAG: hypothetical protein U1E15_13265 [Hyphomicrobiales bacterium]
MAFASEARADSLRPPPGQHWIAVASTKDKDTAMAIADYYSECHGRVVTSKSGWLAVVLGPYAGKSIAAIQKEHSEIIDLPKDARLSNGDSYVDTVWQSKPWAESRPLSSYSTGKPAQFSSGGLTFKVEMQGDEDNPGPTHAVAAQGSTGVFSFETPNEYSQFESNAGLVRLDPATDAPQLVFTRYTGGAHCCTETWIVSSPKDGTGWTLIDTGPLDGGGYSYEDLDGDGALELVHPDNDFLYAFDSYAGSYAPVRVQQLRGGKLVDVSDMDAFRPVLRRDLARMEFEAKLDPGLWKSNGFLAGWLAAKMRLGQGEEAWQVVSENLESGTDFGPMICTSAKEPNDLENCPDQDQVRVPIRKALAQFLNERDYGELPQGALAAMN